MKYEKPIKGKTPLVAESLKLPPVFNQAARKTALDIDALLTRDQRSAKTLDARISVHRQAGISELTTLGAPLIQ